MRADFLQKPSIWSSQKFAKQQIGVDDATSIIIFTSGKIHNWNMDLKKQQQQYNQSNSLFKVRKSLCIISTSVQLVM